MELSDEQREFREEELKWLNSSIAADVSSSSCVVHGSISPLGANQQIAGPVQVVALSKDDNAGIRRLLNECPVINRILVAAGGDDSTTAVVGEITAYELWLAGVRAIVTDGLVRDSTALLRSALQIWSRGTTPMASRKEGSILSESTVVLGGVVVQTGDYIIADNDGIVVWKETEKTALLNEAWRRARDDEKRLREVMDSGGKSRGIC